MEKDDQSPFLRSHDPAIVSPTDTSGEDQPNFVYVSQPMHLDESAGQTQASTLVFSEGHDNDVHSSCVFTVAGDMALSTLVSDHSETQDTQHTELVQYILDPSLLSQDQLDAIQSSSIDTHGTTLSFVTSHESTPDNSAHEQNQTIINVEQSQQVVLQSGTDQDDPVLEACLSANVPDTRISKDDHQNTVNDETSSFPQVFSEVKAVFSDYLVKILEEDIDSLLEEMKKEEHLYFTGKSQDNKYSVECDLKTLVQLEQRIYQLIKNNQSESRADTLKSNQSNVTLQNLDGKTNIDKLKERDINVVKVDKGINCELIQPGSSRIRYGKGFYEYLADGKVDCDVETLREKRKRRQPMRKGKRFRTYVPKSFKADNVIGEDGDIECEKDDKEISEKENDECTETPDLSKEQLSKYKKERARQYEVTKPFKYFCKYCSFKTKRHSHYVKHEVLHTNSPNMELYKCSECEFTTIRLVHLRRHQIKHRDASEVLKCSYCSFTTFGLQYLTRHMKIKHDRSRSNALETKVFNCSECSYTSRYASHFDRHLKIHGKIQEPETSESDSGQPMRAVADTSSLQSKYECGKCPYTTQRKEHFVRHLRDVHTNRRPYLCDLCGKSFKRTDALNQHKITHKKREDRHYKFVCPHCQKPFRSQANLNEHVVMHSTNRSFLCEICGASFKTKAVQRKHIQTIHSNPRAFSCDSCDKRFNTKFSLLRHQRTHDTPGMRTVDKATEEQYTVVELPVDQPDVQQIQAIEIQTVPSMIPAETSSDKLVGYTDQSTEAIPQTYIQTSEATSALLYLNLNFN